MFKHESTIINKRQFVMRGNKSDNYLCFLHLTIDNVCQLQFVELFHFFNLFNSFFDTI